jgi:hypothetical protein
VPAPAHVCHRLSAGAVMLAVVSSQPESATERFQQVIRQGGYDRTSPV